MRNLNLAYNSLSADEESNEFIDTFSNYLNKSILSHLNVSGMNLNKDQLLKLSVSAAGNDYLIAIHLSDNNIVFSEDLFEEILDIFGLDSK